MSRGPVTIRPVNRRGGSTEYIRAPWKMATLCLTPASSLAKRMVKGTSGFIARQATVGVSIRAVWYWFPLPSTSSWVPEGTRGTADALGA